MRIQNATTDFERFVGRERMQIAHCINDLFIEIVIGGADATAVPRRLLRCAAMAALLLVGVASCGAEKEFTVNTTEDLHDLDPGDGICAANAGGDQCSLRAAIEETNHAIESLRARINIPPGVYELSLRGELVIDRSLVSVRGAGQSQTIIDALSQSRILNIGGNQARQVTFESLTLRNGRTAQPESGGAVLIESPDFLVTFTSVTIEDSVANFHGGGIYAAGSGTLNVINSVIRGNSSTEMPADCNGSGGGASGGGGIYASGPSVNVLQSEIRDNCGSNGAGIQLLGGANHLILRSTVAGNRGPTTGAGIYMQNARGRMEDSTVARNAITMADAAAGNAAGIHLIDSELTILSSTIAENENPFEGEDGAGGIFIDNSSVTMRNTVLADNHVFGARECHGSIDSQGGNFIGETTDCDIAAQGSDNLDAGDPELDDLQYNGGLTRTMLPVNGSPLVDAGVSGCEPIDQRGLAFLAPSGDCDVGSVER